MEQEKKEVLIKLFNELKGSGEYRNRKNAVVHIPVLKEIIIETLKKDKLTNQDLTDLIQVLKWNCSNDNFDNKLNHLILDPVARKRISDKAYELEVAGFTNAGKTGISALNKQQLESVKQFLLNANNVKNVLEAKLLCETFEKLNIPEVKRGIYSPWLFYINPKIFPIVNNTHKAFKDFFNISDYYPETLIQFNEINEILKEPDLAALDTFGHHFTKNGKLNYRRRIFLNGKKLFKISHGIFYKSPKYRNTGILEVLESKNWVSINESTGKGAGDTFYRGMEIGDFIYVCYGGDKLHCIGIISSEANPFPTEYANMIEDYDGEWLYREFKPLVFPIDSNAKDLKEYRSQIMPSGNSTLWAIKDQDLDYMNETLFIPKYNAVFKQEDSSEEYEQYIDNNKKLENMNVLNSILYGPPGTGKTFHSINHAVAIVENESIENILAEKRESIKDRFDKYLMDGQIVFCTFHQSLSYEDFIEGIKPIPPETEEEELTYDIVDGIFKRLCTEAAFSIVQEHTTTETEKVLDFSSEYDRFVDIINELFSKGEKVEIETRSGGNVIIENISQRNNIGVRHIDGNRKYTVSKKRLSKIAQAYPDLTSVTNINDQFRAEIGGSNSSAYWAVLNAIRKQTTASKSEGTKTISEKEYLYEDKKEIVFSLKNRDYKIENPKKYVIIIDEINRGNVSQIFGELITLIEDDKRLGKEEALTSILPYSKEKFGVPFNVSIIGTMNTADRSVEALDTALRRRFSFVAIAPKPEELKITKDGINLPAILQVLNNRLSILKDNDHTIGHAWLWYVTDLKSLKTVFRDKILPLLQEYFYNDYEKLGLVLGDTFFEPHIEVSSNIFASFSGGNGLAGQYDQSWQYRLKSIDELTLSDFKSLEQSKIQLIVDEE